jgi:dihydroorotate dehydrogenase (NAD+) catalytic subunit
VIAAVVNELPDIPVWAKLSPNVTDLTEIAGAALAAGASALTLINTVMGMVIDLDTRRPRLGAGGGGLSGPAIRPVAVRAVYECRKAYPDAPIVGVGGVATGEHAVELLLAGADAVQIGTASFYDPHAPARVLAELESWCASHGITSLTELTGAAHG